jgi:DNA-binding NarL/FixJ family response regulator
MPNLECPERERSTFLMTPYRIVLADDHALFRQGLKRTLEEVSGLTVVGEAGDGLDLLKLLSRVKSHLVILDISMPNLRGLEAIGEIKKAHPDLKVLMVTMYKEKEYLLQALANGADGYFLKKDADKELFTAIERVRQGGNYVSPGLSEILAEDWKQIRQEFRAPVLTLREREILKLIADGKSSREIADSLCISIHTVERHRANIMEKVGVRRTADLVKYALQKGYA